MPDSPFHPDPLLRPPIKPIKQNMTCNQNLQNVQEINPNIIFDFKENSPFQEGVMSEMIQRLDKSFFQEPKELGDIINKGNFVHKYLPKQMVIDKILRIMQRNVLKGTHLPIEIKEIHAGYLCSPYFKDLYLYLSQNKLPSSKLNQKIRNISRKICFIRLNIVQNIVRERGCSPSSTRNMHRQDYNPIPQKFVCRTPRSYKNLLDH